MVGRGKRLRTMMVLVGLVAGIAALTKRRTRQENRTEPEAAGTKPRKRVLMLLENARFEDDPRVRNEARALTEAGYDITVICPGMWGDPIHEVLDNVRIYRYSAPRDGSGTLGYLFEYGYSLAAIAVLSLYVRLRRGFDFVHAHNPPDVLALIAAAYRPFGARVIFDHHDLAPEMYLARFGDSGRSWLYRAQSLAEFLACRLAHHVIASNESYKRREMELSGIPPERITVVRNGPDPDQWKPVDPDPDLRARSKAIIGYAGVIGQQDGVDYLLRALHHLVHSLGRRDAFCVIIGEGDARLDLMQLASELGLDDHVWFTGWVPHEDFVRYLSTIDIGVVPDPSNPFTDRSTMLKLMNYMAFHKPVVAFDLPEHRASGADIPVYVPPNDVAAFAEAIASLMDDPDRRAALGARGRERVEQHLAWHYSIPPLLRAYECAAGDAPQERVTGATREPGFIAGARRALGSSRMMQLQYYAIRAMSLGTRYGLGTARAERRLLDCVALLQRYDGRPTFATPGRVVARKPEFFRRIQDLGAELAVHGYDHVDFRRLAPDEAAAQYRQAVQAFEEAGLTVDGFRCPYLSFSSDQHPALPNGVFRYSSNRALWWDVIPSARLDNATPVMTRLLASYQPESAERKLALPWMEDGLLEIPVSLPEDLQLYDGLRLGPEAVADVWIAILQQIHARGELFVLMFHPELFDRSATALEAVLREARALTPRVWITDLRSISQWWAEKAAFKAELHESDDQLEIHFDATDPATVLVRNLDCPRTSRPWFGNYHILESRSLRLPAGLRPIVGVGPEAPSHAVTLLRDLGYIVDTSPAASLCTVFLDQATLATLPSDVALVEHIEKQRAPLVRFGTWPNAARCALSITGDADALSLTDYLARVAR